LLQDCTNKIISEILNECCVERDKIILELEALKELIGKKRQQIFFFTVSHSVMF